MSTAVVSSLRPSSLVCGVNKAGVAARRMPYPILLARNVQHSIKIGCAFVPRETDIDRKNTHPARAIIRPAKVWTGAELESTSLS